MDRGISNTKVKMMTTHAPMAKREKDPWAMNSIKTIKPARNQIISGLKKTIIKSIEHADFSILIFNHNIAFMFQ